MKSLPGGGFKGANRACHGCANRMWSFLKVGRVTPLTSAEACAQSENISKRVSVALSRREVVHPIVTHIQSKKKIRFPFFLVTWQWQKSFRQRSSRGSLHEGKKCTFFLDWFCLRRAEVVWLKSSRWFGWWVDDGWEQEVRCPHIADRGWEDSVTEVD